MIYARFKRTALTMIASGVGLIITALVVSITHELTGPWGLRYVEDVDVIMLGFGAFTYGIGMGCAMTCKQLDKESAAAVDEAEFLTESEA